MWHRQPVFVHWLYTHWYPHDPHLDGEIMLNHVKNLPFLWDFAFTIPSPAGTFWSGGFTWLRVFLVTTWPKLTTLGGRCWFPTLSETLASTIGFWPSIDGLFHPHIWRLPLPSRNQTWQWEVPCKWRFKDKHKGMFHGHVTGGYPKKHTSSYSMLKIFSVISTPGTKNWPFETTKQQDATGHSRYYPVICWSILYWWPVNYQYLKAPPSSPWWYTSLVQSLCKPCAIPPTWTAPNRGKTLVKLLAGKGMVNHQFNHQLFWPDFRFLDTPPFLLMSLSLYGWWMLMISHKISNFLIKIYSNPMKSQKSTGQLPPFDGKAAVNLAGARSCARMRLERTRRFGFASGAGVGTPAPGHWRRMEKRI